MRSKWSKIESLLKLTVNYKAKRQEDDQRKESFYIQLYYTYISFIVLQALLQRLLKWWWGFAGARVHGVRWTGDEADWLMRLIWANLLPHSQLLRCTFLIECTIMASNSRETPLNQLISGITATDGANLFAGTANNTTNNNTTNVTHNGWYNYYPQILK